jgi:hypothetical protein
VLWVSVDEPKSMARADLEVNAQRLARALLKRKVGKVVILLPLHPSRSGFAVTPSAVIGSPAPSRAARRRISLGRARRTPPAGSLYRSGGLAEAG